METLSAIQSFPIDLVLLDIILPDFDGIELLKQLTESYSHVQVIMMTGNATIETAIASM